MGKTAKLSVKVLMATGAALAGLAALAPVAHAQVGVYDSRNEEELIEIKNRTEDIKTNTNNIHEFQINDTRPHYEAELVRLNNMIRSLSHVTVDSTADDSDKRSDIFAKIEANTADRTRISSVRDGGTSNYGIEIGGSGVSSDYYSKYGWVAPSSIYTDTGLRTQLEQLHNAMYFAEATAGEVDSTREARLNAYKELATLAEQSGNVKQSLELNNAILIENGRNLALLIEMQTAALNAKAAELRETAREQQAIADTFGVDDSFFGIPGLP